MTLQEKTGELLFRAIKTASDWRNEELHVESHDMFNAGIYFVTSRAAFLFLGMLLGAVFSVIAGLYPALLFALGFYYLNFSLDRHAYKHMETKTKKDHDIVDRVFEGVLERIGAKEKPDEPLKH